jgi:hypothetical protein
MRGFKSQSGKRQSAHRGLAGGARERGKLKGEKMRLFLLVAALAASISLARAQPAPAGGAMADVEGVWVSHNELGPKLFGALVIEQGGGVWRASLGRARAQGAALDLAFPDGQGRFRGEVVEGGRAIEGWWVQPPGLPGQAYATPMRLTRTRPHAWRGEVQPLPQRFTLYLNIASDGEGRWVGAFRNPQFNMNGGASRFFVTRSGDTLSFTTPEGKVVREATLSGRGMRVPSPPLPEPLDLQRVGDHSAEPYLPRTIWNKALSPLANTQDGWATARPREMGFDEARLTDLVAAVATSDPFARRPQLIHSLLIARGGRIVVEEYFHGFDRETPHDLRSAGKTFASVMLGAVIAEGGDIGPQTKLFDVLAPDGPFANPDPRKHDITLAHLMTHTSGLACNDNDDASQGNEGMMQGQNTQPNWWRFALDLPVAHPAGARYAYCTAGMNLVGAALHRATGESVAPLFHRLIARPMQFGRYSWNLMPNGEGYLGGGV